jgi:signal transduction histidine kinase
VVSTRLYNFTFFPYVIAVIAGVLVFAIGNLRGPATPKRRHLLMYSVGLFLLCVGGILDLVMLYQGHRFLQKIPTWSLWGLLAFLIVTTAIFIEQLIIITRERSNALHNLIGAYRELEGVHALKDMGQSAAVITREVQNALFAIGANARLLNKEFVPDEKRKSYAGKIRQSVSHLMTFSDDVVEGARTKIAIAKKPLRLSALVYACIEKNFKGMVDRIALDDRDGDGAIIEADAAKLELVFVSLVKNAFESGAKNVRIAVLASEKAAVCTVEDNGAGCAPDRLGSLFASLNSAKKKPDRAGLGLSIVRSIVESHGGVVGVYAKNGMGRHDQGLIFCLCFERYDLKADSIREHQDPVVFIKNGLLDIATVFQVFANVRITPLVVANVQSAEVKLPENGGWVVLASVASACEASAKFGQGHRYFELAQNPNRQVLIKRAGENKPAQLFTEEYVLRRVIGSEIPL